MILKFNSYLYYLLPIALVTGPFLSDLFISLIAITTLIFIIKKKLRINLLKNKFLLLLILFYLYLILNSLFVSTDTYHSLESSFVYLRFIFFYIGFNLLIHSVYNFKNHVFYFIIFTLGLVSIDALIQYFLGVNLIGLEARESRVSGFFGEEYILGSYLVKILPIACALFYFLKENNKLRGNIDYLFIFFLFITIFAILISGERAAFISCLGFLLISSVYLFKFKYSIIILIVTVIISLFVLNFLDGPRERIINETQKEIKFNLEGDITNLIPINHKDLFHTSLNIGLENKLFGVGVNNFRNECKNYYPNKCNTHPHNTYLQLFAELGYFGVLFLIILYSYLVYKLIIFLYKKINGIEYDKYLLVLTISCFILFIPFMTNGNFFNNYLSILYFFNLSYLFNIKFDQISTNE